MDYDEFLEHLEPTILGLDSSTFALNRDVYWSRPKNARRVLSSKYSLAHVDKDYFDVQASLGVVLQWSEGDGPLVQALRIDCVFTGHFHAAAPLAQENAQKFTDRDSWLVFWPFFRQFVSDTTARMAIPPIVVPMALGPGEYSYPQPAKAIKPAQKLRARLAAQKK